MPMKSREQVNQEYQANEAKMQKLQVAVNECLTIRAQYQGYVAAIDDAENELQVPEGEADA